MKKLLSIIAFVGFGLGLYYFYNNNPAVKKDTPFVVCLSKSVADIDCPGCGGQRAFHELLHGNFIKAARLNPFIYFFIPLLTYAFFKITLNSFNINLPDINISNKRLWFVLFLMVVFTVIRNMV